MDAADAVRATLGVDGERRVATDGIVLAALLLLTTILGPTFARLGIDAASLYVTELTLACVVALVLYRRGARGAIRDARRVIPVWLLGTYWLFGAIAAARGLTSDGLSDTLFSIGLVEYSVLLPIVAVVACDRRRVALLERALVIGSAGAVLIYLVSYVSMRIWGPDDGLIATPGSAYGLYMSFLLVWVAARSAHRLTVSPWLATAAGLGVLLMGLTEKRSVLVIAITALVLIAALAPRGRRLRAVTVLAVLLPVGFASIYGLQFGLERLAPLPDPDGIEAAPVGDAPAAPTLPNVTAAPTIQERRETPQIAREIVGLGGEPGQEGDNVTWRLAFWGELLGRSRSDPVFGVGLGEPLAFVWRSRRYDFRDGAPNTGIDVAGPHNDFIHILYRMGVPALASLVALVAVALARVRPLLSAPATTAEQRAELTGLLGMLVATIGAAFFNDGLKVPYMGIFFWTALGLLFVRGRLGSTSGPDYVPVASLTKPATNSPI